MALIENTLFGIENKVKQAIKFLRAYEPPEGYYLADSGGKDSTVVRRLLQMSGVKFDAHHNLTTVDPPELVYFVREHHQDTIIERPPMTMWQLIPQKGFPPTRIIRYCCAVLKEGHGMGRWIATGIRAAESVKRTQRRSVEQSRKNKNTFFINPIFRWTDSEVWEFIKADNIPYCELYNSTF